MIEREGFDHFPGSWKGDKMVFFIFSFLTRKLSQQTGGFSVCLQLLPPILYRVVIEVIKSVHLTPLSLAASPGRVGALLRVAEISLAVGQVGQAPAAWPCAGSKGK